MTAAVYTNTKSSDISRSSRIISRLPTFNDLILQSIGPIQDRRISNNISNYEKGQSSSQRETSIFKPAIFPKISIFTKESVPHILPDILNVKGATSMKNPTNTPPSNKVGYYGLGGTLEGSVPSGEIIRSDTDVTIIEIPSDYDVDKSRDKDPNYGIEQQWLLFQRQGDQYDRLSEWNPDQNLIEDTSYDKLPRPQRITQRYGYDEDYERMLEYQENEQAEQTGKYDI